MNKSEIIFFIAIILAYLACSVMLNVSASSHLLFIGIVLVIIAIAVISKYRKNYENEKISGIAKMISAILIIFVIIAVILGIVLKNALLINYQILIILAFISMVIAWFFGKKEE